MKGSGIDVGLGEGDDPRAHWHPALFPRPLVQWQERCVRRPPLVFTDERG